MIDAYLTVMITTLIIVFIDNILPVVFAVCRFCTILFENFKSSGSSS